ncbi:MAG: hypothetical protein HY778_00480 [Betaproteobacteria bacterium]|nr:hypothetical protein [Betaproteobacteria bacterium]
MDRCPACRGRLDENQVCGRCGCDFSLARRAEEQARRIAGLAVRAWARGERAQARAWAQRSLSLHRSGLAQAVLMLVEDDPRACRQC